MAVIYGTHLLQIFIFGITSEIKEKKMAQNDKEYVSRIPYLRKHSSYDCDFWYTYVKG